MDLTEERYRIDIDGRWSLEDLYIFPHVYEQVYFLIYSLLPLEDKYILERIKYAYSQYPWRGGYSAVNFYNKLKFTTPKLERPQVLSLQYASPGWIELSLIIGVALNIEKLVKIIASSIKEANAVYHEIHAGLAKRELLRVKLERERLKLEKEHASFIRHSNKSIANMMQLKELEQMHEKTGSELKTLKILLSLFRRIKILAEFQTKGKTKF